MKFKKRTAVQLISALTAATMSIIYFLYIHDYIDFRILSMGDMNPYGGWTALKSYFTDLSYRFRGLTSSISLTAAVLILALFGGRFFCGFICPVGSLQDFFKYVGSKIGIKEKKLYRAKQFKPEMMKYIILILVLCLSVLGYGSLISPFSPWLAYLNLFFGFNVYFGTYVLLLIIFVSLFVKRVFCRCLCPLGAVQSLLYAVGPMKINKSETCSSCGECLKNCPVDIEKSEDDIVSPECINCLECTGSNCIIGREGFAITFSNRIVMKGKYIIICLCLFFGIYIMLPVLKSPLAVQTIASIGNLSNGTYEGSGIGFGGNIDVAVCIKENKIIEIRLLSNRETTGYYEETIKVMSKEIIGTQNLNLDAISGATASGRGFLSAVKDAVSKSLE